MPQKNLQELEQKITKQLRLNTLVAGVSAVAGFSLLIPAFSLQGSKFDYQTFCFDPPVVHNPEQHEYCTGDKIKRGIAWRIAVEIANSAEFRNKVSFSEIIPAQNPHAGLYGLCGAGFFFVSFLMFKQGTEQLADNLDVVVWNKKSLVLEREFRNNQHLDIEKLKTQHEQEFVSDIMNRDHADAMYDLMGDGEKELAAKNHQRAQELEDTQFELKKATMKAQTAEQQEKEVKHQKEIEKLNKSSKQKDSKASDLTGNEAAKAELTEKLKEHEGGWLYTLCTSKKPLYLVGDQGSYKSYSAACIALCRFHLKGWRIQTLIDPHLHQNANKAWKEILHLVEETYGKNQNWEQVNEGIQDILESWNVREEDKDEIITTILDEVTNYSLHDECKQSAAELGRRIISDPRKANDAVILIMHEWSNEARGGATGFAKSTKSGTFQLELRADDDLKPMFRGCLSGAKDENGVPQKEMEVTLPDWFRPEKIAAMFKESGKQA